MKKLVLIIAIYLCQIMATSLFAKTSLQSQNDKNHIKQETLTENLLDNLNKTDNEVYNGVYQTIVQFNGKKRLLRISCYSKGWKENLRMVLIHYQLFNSKKPNGTPLRQMLMKQRYDNRSIAAGNGTLIFNNLKLSQFNYSLNGSYEKVGDEQSALSTILPMLRGNFSHYYQEKNGFYYLGDAFKNYKGSGGHLILFIPKDSLNKVLLGEEISLLYRYSRGNEQAQNATWLKIFGGTGEVNYISEINTASYLIKVIFGIQQKDALESVKKDYVRDVLPFIKTINIKEANLGQNHFVVTMNAIGKVSRIETTQLARDFDRSVEEAFRVAQNNSLKKARNQRVAEMTELSKKGKNASGELLDLNFITYAGITLENLYYGNFSDVNNSYFNDLHNMFVFAVHQQKNYLKTSKLLTVEFNIVNYEYEDYVSSVEKHHYNISMDERFAPFFLQNLSYKQFILGKGFQYEDIENILEKYPADNKVFIQLHENVYRFSVGLPPLNNFNEVGQKK